MTAKISQHVLVRRRFQQRGSVDHSTITIGLGLTGLVMVTLLGFFYLQQVIHTAAQGTDAQVMESQVVELKDRQRALELEGAQLRSLQTVEQRVQKLNLVLTDKVSYLAAKSNQVALIAP